MSQLVGQPVVVVGGADAGKDQHARVQLGPDGRLLAPVGVLGGHRVHADLLRIEQAQELAPHLVGQPHLQHLLLGGAQAEQGGGDLLLALVRQPLGLVDGPLRDDALLGQHRLEPVQPVRLVRLHHPALAEEDGALLRGVADLEAAGESPLVERGEHPGHRAALWRLVDAFHAPTNVRFSE
ncbi:MAG TPA: hypothetical protein VN914_10610 [Polyangia bacterium]|nr:hypothetical protein [Polyangia bacterium]